MAATVDPRTFLLSSFLYTGHVKNGDFDGVTRWVQGLPRVRSRWVFGICEAAHWVAIETTESLSPPERESRSTCSGMGERPLPCG
jgi:Ulp1 family protease